RSAASPAHPYVSSLTASFLYSVSLLFFFNHPAPTEIYTLSLHDALPIFTRDPVSGQTPSEAERIDAIVRIAKKTEEVGLDVFAIGEHHNPPFFSSAPTTLLSHIAATTTRLVVSTATTLITTNDPVRIAEEY